MHTKNQFIQILHGYLSSTEDDARQIQALTETFPYSQVLHALHARLSKDHSLPSQKEDLQQAAVHAADRTVLKDIMTRVHAWPVSHEASGQVHPDAPPSISGHHVAADAEEDTVAEGIMNELNKLHELRHNFESMFESETPSVNSIKAEPEPVEPPAVEIKASEVREEPKQEETPPVKKPKGRVGRKPGRAKAQRIIDLAKALENQAGEDTPAPDNPRPKKPRQKKNVSGPDEIILNDIEHSKKKLSPESGKQQEQLEIINQFISSEARISNLKDKASTVSTADLTTIKSGEFGEHLVSETLVEILINQGKKERAIEVLKKLIWKFPQKKAYFAAQIEDLRK
ncbi:MAG TPA: hypothetical protein VKZ75_12115 [Cyclobacteriaceae bacterium]|nr:hypothetical protein [Cyclobacteriaceae bacterium]